MAETVCLPWGGVKQVSPADAPAHTLRAQAGVIEGLLNLAAEGQDFENSFRTALRMIQNIDQDILRDHIDEVPSRVLSALSLIKVRSVDTLQEYPPASFVAGIDAVVAAVKRWPEPLQATADREEAATLALFHREFEAFAARRLKKTHERGGYKRREAAIATLRLVPRGDIFG